MPKKSIFDRYETYDTSTGYGNPDEWRSSFNSVLGNNTTTDEARQELGIGINSSIYEIQIAYKNLAKKYHPDKNPNGIEKFQRISRAYKTLTSATQTIKIVKPQEQPTSIYKPQLLNEILENEVERYLTDIRYCAQEKHDGRRKMLKYEKGNTLAINKKGLTVGCPQCIENDCNEIASLFNLQEFLLDGEEVGDDFYVFDILSLNLNDLRNKSYDERFRNIFLKNVIDKHIKCVSTNYSESEKRDLFLDLKTENKEGIVFKLLSGVHKSGYSDDQLKFKFYATASVVVIKHNLRNSVGVAIYQNGNLIPIGNVTMIGHQIPNINSIIEVKYLYAYRGGCLYQPSFLDYRDDVEIQDCTLEKLKFKPQ